ncbi:hypothetical protein [Cryptosporangium aurantiacum]|uniref:SnoaL-like domain-containing protein n=1 Tax=Cryptosporangium aurantiacum TaxID=134849 RepID=A0A1M7RA80_9ACTN|nr:hypothetical protein [Cryptosporangium aurantiacum]SHN43061.1 hypothetical protein SAMN05443668_10912 [Cryptosporangium aurantiacum]
MTTIEHRVARLEDGRWLIARPLITPAAGLVALGGLPGRGRPTSR